VNGGFGPPKNFGVAPLCQLVLRGPLRGWGGKEGRGTEREKRGRNEEKGRGGKLEQGRRLAKAGPAARKASENCLQASEKAVGESLTGLRPTHCRVATLGKLFTPMCLCRTGAGGLVVEYRIRNFHVAGANLAQAICKQP